MSETDPHPLVCTRCGHVWEQHNGRDELMPDGGPCCMAYAGMGGSCGCDALPQTHEEPAIGVTNPGSHASLGSEGQYTSALDRRMAPLTQAIWQWFHYEPVPAEDFATQAIAIADAADRAAGVVRVRTDDATVANLAWLMWCFEEGYTNSADREGMDNHFLDEPDSLHPDDAAEISHRLAAARAVLEVLVTP